MLCLITILDVIHLLKTSERQFTMMLVFLTKLTNLENYWLLEIWCTPSCCSVFSMYELISEFFRSVRQY